MFRCMIRTVTALAIFPIVAPLVSILAKLIQRRLSWLGRHTNFLRRILVTLNYFYLFKHRGGQYVIDSYANFRCRT
jgi:hypothetical protein